MDPGPSWLLCPRDFQGKNTGVGCHFLLQGIFPTQELNPNLLHWQADFLPLSHQASPWFCIHLRFKVWSLDQIPQYSSPGNLLNSHLRPRPRITLTRCPGGWCDIKVWETLLWETPFRGESTTNFNVFTWLIISRHLLLLSPNAYFTNNHTYFFLTVLCKALF